MKHVFYIHSGITYVVTLATIDHLKLTRDQVVIILCRNIQVANEYQVLKLTPEEEQIQLLPTYGSKEVLKNFDILWKLDKRLSIAIGHMDFTLYLPSEKNFLMQFLQTHSLCKKRHFIEEGILTYQLEFKKVVPTRRGIRNHLRHWLRTPYHLFRTTVGQSQQPDNLIDFTVFVATRTAELLLKSFTVEYVDVNRILKSRESDYHRVINLYIFDAVVEMGLSDSIPFMQSLESFIVNQVPRKNLHIKFHPYQKDHKRYLEIFDKYKIDYALLGPEVIPEVLIVQSNSMAVYGLASSVLFYANEIGHQVYSFSPALAQADAKYKAYLVNSTPSFIIESLNLL